MSLSGVPVPVGAVGRVGLVALLRRVRPEAQGRLVLVQRPIGPDTSLSNTATPVFAWQVLVLGEPVDIGGKPCRQIHVADSSLMPVSQLDTEQAKAVSDKRARQNRRSAWMSCTACWKARKPDQRPAPRRWQAG